MILIADEMHPQLMTALSAASILFDYRPNCQAAEALKVMASYHGIVIRSKFQIDRAFIDSCPFLKFIARAGSGTDNIDALYAEQKGITVLHAPEALCDAVAEHAIGLMLALQHKIISGAIQVKSGLWNREYHRGTELLNSTLGIIGYGHTGSALAKKLTGFGMTILTYDKYKTPLASNNGSFFFDDHATSCTLETIYEQADILTLHIPLTFETRMWVDKKFFDRFKKPIVFINTSRGQIVHTEALIDAIKDGKVKAAGLDVLEIEPPFGANENYDTLMQRLTALERVIITPHVAGWSEQSYLRISEVLGRKIIGFYGKSV